MTESKLWHNKTEVKNAKAAKMVELIKTCDQYLHKSFFQHHNPLTFLLGENRFSESAVWVKSVISFSLRESFTQKNEQK